MQRNEISSAPSTPSPAYIPIRFNTNDRRTFIGGSDARIIMGDDEAELIRLWREKRGEVAGRSADNLVVQFGAVTENLNRRWYHRNTGFTNKDLS